MNSDEAAGLFARALETAGSAADLGATTDARGTAVLVAFAADADADVRLEVARSLPAVMPDGADDAGVAALIDLCRDADPEVRNWATFGLGWQSTADGRTVRRALWERTGDSYPPVREEGIRGLARRRDQRALPMVADLLAEESVDGCTFEAAGYLGQPSLVPLLERFDPAGRGVAAALRECDPRRRGRRDTLALRLLDAVRVHLPVGQISIFCEHFELGLHLEVTDARPGLGPLRWSVEALLERADDDPDLAARLVTHDLAS
ncbi:HEAT repeat domain-containing protein [Micromonospora sp. LZ34]